MTAPRPHAQCPLPTPRGAKPHPSHSPPSWGCPPHLLGLPGLGVPCPPSLQVGTPPLAPPGVCVCVCVFPLPPPPAPDLRGAVQLVQAQLPGLAGALRVGGGGHGGRGVLRGGDGTGYRRLPRYGTLPSLRVPAAPSPSATGGFPRPPPQKKPSSCRSPRKRRLESASLPDGPG